MSRERELRRQVDEQDCLLNDIDNLTNALQIVVGEMIQRERDKPLPEHFEKAVVGISYAMEDIMKKWHKTIGI